MSIKQFVPALLAGTVMLVTLFGVYIYDVGYRDGTRAGTEKANMYKQKVAERCQPWSCRKAGE